MEFLKLLLNVGLIMATSTVSCTDDISEIIQRLPTGTIPIHYNINLTVYLEEGNFNFYGETSVKIKIRHVLPKISLHSQELKINETATTLIKDNGIVHRPKEHTHDNVTNILTLNFNNALSPGLYTLKMKFAGSLSESSLKVRGFMKNSYTDLGSYRKWMAVTSFEPNTARRMFPCWDEPALKATFEISVTHYQKYGVLSNMPIREQHVVQDGIVRTDFNTTPVMSTYLVAIVMSDFVRIPNVNGTINMWCSSSLRSKVKFAHTVAEKIESLLIKYTNSSKKIPKMDHVVIQNYPINGMENWGLIVYNDISIIYDDSIHPIYHRRQVATLVAHEVVHQWFGNLVTPSWWSYLWLSEGFAVFFESYFLNKVFEDWRMMDVFVVRNMHDCLIADIGMLGPVTLRLGSTLDSEKIFAREVYKKAPALLRMLLNTITDKVFQKGIITYLTRHQFSSATPDDLWSAMQSALNESEVPHEGYRIKEVMDTWMNQNHYPVVNVVKNYKTGVVTISQECFRGTEADGSINNTWWIPITFATQSNPDFSNTVPSYWLRPGQSISFEINPNDWIIVNIQQSGYYRVNYDIRNWEKIVTYLNSEEYTKIHVLNRAQIISDSYIFLLDGETSGYLFFNLLNYLSRETDYIAWHPTFRVLQWLSLFLPLPESKDVKLQMLGLLDGLLRNVGYEENSYDDDITKLKRLDTLEFACTFGHVGCKQMAAVKLSEHLADPDTHKIPQWWQEWTYCAGMAVANRTTWDKMMKLYENKPDKALLKRLSCAEDPDIIKNYLNITALNTSLFDDKVHCLIFGYILENHADNDLILDYILNNFEIIRPRSNSVIETIKLILQNIHSNKQVDKVKRFSETSFNQDLYILSEIQIMINKRKVYLEVIGNAFKNQILSGRPAEVTIDPINQKDEM